MTPAKTAPHSVQQLLDRALLLAGLTLGELALWADIRVPANFKREKGWTGQLLELYLGAQAGSKPQQDFPEIGVELKTIPIGQLGQPLETTYVCYAPLTQIAGVQWETSSVRNKLNCVLWIPIEGDRDIPPAQRRIATAFLWQPSSQQLELLQQDWEELLDMIALGEVENITAKHGQALQLRPKAADGSVLTDAIGADGALMKTRPRGFYLRKQFTQQILLNAFAGE
ncbi:DNA mismatch repair endonuclease MutH [Aliiglaciecola sp. LCG003]|uniref:DNA mismatch repair endonuclease MutH n=1 Tax=Aliiglaciecola sp. LCG003 TaxID=3053655 RepID=UPI002573A39F|nr:DNA mismatch repair endonuclease MutH [Aliiglaciecola sp. LCG003]WJG11339.1 DNA mismatch repair endonuclease MutH [Aliiglaciecola sp. LCG003]